MEEINKSIRAMKILKHVMHSIKQSMGQRFGEVSLTGPQGMLMGILAHCGEMKISDLSDKLGLSNSTVSGIIDRLEKQGFVERIRSKEDRRIVYVNVTPEFKRNAKEHFSEVEKRFQDMMSRATPDEIDTILEGLATLQSVVDRQNENL